MSILTSLSRVNAYTSFQRLRLLPNTGQVFVRIGQEVNPVQVIAQSLPRGGFATLNAIDELEISADEIQAALLVEPGASLRKDMPILRKPGKLGRSKTMKSPVNGIFVELRQGTIVIQVSQETHDLRAMMHGRVISTIPGRGAVIETRGSFVQALWDSGKDGNGKIRTVVRSAKEPLNTDRIGGDIRGSVLVAGWISSPDDLLRLENSGVRGIITGSMTSKICLMGSTLTYPIFLTDGVGEQAMSEPIFQVLQRADGRQVSLLTQFDGIKGQRSEIIIPSASTQSEIPFKIRRLENGDLVRVFRWDGGNIIGRVSRIETRPERTPLGILSPGAEIEFGSGIKKFIPYANIDLLT